MLAFCEVYGSPLYACAEENPQVYSLRIGTLKQRHELGSPQRQIWAQRRLSWVTLPAELEAFDGQP